MPLPLETSREAIMRELIILGSTGSIGKNALAVAKHLGPDRVRIRGLAVRSNITLLEEQIAAFHPAAVAVGEVALAHELQERHPRLTVLAGDDGIAALAADTVGHPLVISAMSGTAGLVPTVSAIRAGNDVALANKEVLVSGGQYVTALARQKGVRLLPIDSEHSALFQCLQGIAPRTVRRLIITASGGPFRTFTPEQLASVTLEEALCHPNWLMGPKNTIDSSTLMNKGLEVIEAHWLFDVPVDRIEVVIHPQSIIHSMVECSDSSILAQMGIPDMRLPIQYAITYPERLPSLIAPFDFTAIHRLDFTPPDLTHFKCLKLAYDALHADGSLSCFMNAANEVLVARFLQRQIPWHQIGDGLEELMSRHHSLSLGSLDDILAVDSEGRSQAAQLGNV